MWMAQGEGEASGEAGEAGEEGGEEEGDESDDDLDTEALVTLTFKELFPESFQQVLPVRNHRVRHRRVSDFLP